jgi:ABC-type nitrate/sulfonate/bicarbonate transport system permease component
MTVAAPAMTSRGPERSKRRIKIPNERLFYAVVGFVGLLILWEFATNFDLDPNTPGIQGLVKRILMSAPTLIWKAGVEDFTSGVIWPHIAISLQEWFYGFLISVFLGITLGLSLGWFRRFRLATQPLVSALYSTPTIALFPLIVLIAGIGLESKVILVVLASIFAVIINTMVGVQSVSWKHLEIASSFGASQAQIVRSVVIPTTIPFILTGVRLAAGRSLVGVVVAEFQAANQGVGFYISLNGQTLNTARVFIGLVLLGGFGIFVGELVRLVENRFDAWRPSIHR